MVGDLSNGAPDKLILTPATQTAISSAPAGAQPTPPAANDDDADESDAEPRPVPREQMPPGFIRGGSNSATATPPQTPKTPQQLFQELLAMRQQQQQQQQQDQSK
jgi:hypothetical protein